MSSVKGICCVFYIKYCCKIKEKKGYSVSKALAAQSPEFESSKVFFWVCNPTVPVAGREG